MILRYIKSRPLPLNLLALLLLLSSAVNVTAEDFSCLVTLGEQSWDLTALGGEQEVQRTRDTPPTTMVDKLRFNLCGDLPSLKDVPEGDQCPSSARACLTKTNQKDGEDRVIAVIPVAESSLDPETMPLSSPSGLSLIFKGPSYPISAEDPIPQSLKFSLLCAEGTTDPEFISYDNGEVHVQWSTPSGCVSTTDQPEDDKTGGGSGGGGGNSDEKPTESVGSGLGFFFLVLLLAFAAYLALGAYYNYSTYGARGVDLIPHRDFWREVPYMLQDVVSHLCSSVRPRRSSRGGYIAV
ncbi:hypothetical protein K503DRAFT_34465 [Rhizopogon vinicolor AM-OR11-026]|uniref:Autophagy-related protein 27 n=1 Tax=Rhizopogon vinicolor AM-OR11-026 TaxID=1314800 RepID=A0A1B7N537_9AGAM|nr:hypothetical protein K503DRAFT_34465 [Rhizopogon vinicolor AM-OR11-026]